ncbi:MAG: CHAT domain-containing tetratricopeptide repeat protein, partial [Pirellulales bacterium]
QAQGNLWKEMGDYTKAETLIQQTLEISTAINDTALAAEALNNLATVKWELADYTAAQKLHERGFTMLSKSYGENSPQAAVSRNNLVGVYKELGDYSKVESMASQSIQILRNNQPKYASELSGCLMNLADFHARQGNFPKAELLLLESIQINERAFGQNHLEVCRTRNNLAALYFDMGQFAKAESLHRLNLKVFEDKLGRDHPNTARVVLNLALVYQNQNRFNDAEAMYQRAIAIRKKALSPVHPDISLTLHNYGQLFTKQGDYAQALKILSEALASRNKTFGPDHPTVGVTNMAIGDAYMGLLSFNEARASYQEAMRVRSQLSESHPQLAYTHTALAEVDAATSKWDSSVDHFDAARRGFRKHIDQSLPSLPEAEQITFLKYTDEPYLHSALSLALAQPQNQKVVDYTAGWVLNGKAVSQQALAQRALIARDTTNSQLASAVKALLVIRKQLASLMMLSDSKGVDPTRQSRIDELARQEQAQSRKLSEQGGRSTGTTSWIELDDVRESLQEGSVLVEVARFRKYDFRNPKAKEEERPEHYVAWIIPKQDGGPIRLIDLGDALQIDQRVREARGALKDAPQLIRENGEEEAEKMLTPSLRALADSILYPLLEAVGTSKTIQLSPDSLLWLVPWSALPLQDGKYAIEQFDIRFLVTGRDLVRSDSTFEVTNPIIFADPDFNLDPAAVEAATQQVLQKPTSERNGLRAVAPSGKFKLGTVSRLPGTKSEAEAVLPQLEQFTSKKATVYSGQYALEAIFKAVRQPRVMVLSTHGFFEEEKSTTEKNSAQNSTTSSNPLLRCGLLLAGCNKPIDASVNDGEDGILTGLEIVSADLRGTELVVLSACETGLGEVRNGEGVSGLRQAFQLAGARAVVSTLWQIPDRETAKLMTSFFVGLAETGDKSESLRASQLNLIEARRDRNGAAHPFFWAAFTITGQ